MDEINRFIDHTILVPGSLGVALLCTGPIKEYRSRFVPRRLDVLAYRTELFDHLNFIDTVHQISLDYRPMEPNFFQHALRDREYRSMLWNLDSQPHRRSIPLHLSQLLADKLGFRSPSLRAIVNLTPSERHAGKNIVENLRAITKKKIVYAGVRSSTPNKEWPVERWRDLVQRSASTVQFIGFDDAAEAVDGILPIHTDIRKTLAVLAQCDACVTVDTFTLHAASAEGIRTPIVIAILGSSHPHVVTYDDTIVFFIASEALDCQPCGRPYSLFDRDLQNIPWRCPDVRCMDAIGSELVACRLLEELNSKQNGIIGGSRDSSKTKRLWRWPDSR
jgi:ADP-heptose:LPS heptosyltransferase